MKKRLIFILSLSGLLMGFLTISIIPFNLEIVLWSVILIFSSYIIAVKCKERIFLHGLYTGILNNIWLTLIHLIFFQSYFSNHLSELSLLANIPAPYSPRVMMIMIIIPIGIIFGILLGVLSLAISATLRRRK